MCRLQCPTQEKEYSHMEVAKWRVIGGYIVGRGGGGYYRGKVGRVIKDGRSYRSKWKGVSLGFGEKC